ncbi:hypothetical protein K456DRAFT_1774996 [Colletotrichum gloeosporioides 23]|nr:hypothetical protein K456DRAFT_1774996 [Colletotrichum gloeosporioides 23]KAJ0279806.1 hypothetical protein COL940_006548 [Colletotrichum noveboracense]
MFPFFRSPQVPSIVPTDTIVPLSAGDDNFVNKSIVMLFMMRFDDVLDPDKLRVSLEKLLERDGWRKLGARLRLNANKKLEYHIPTEYGPKRPAIAYSHVTFQVDIEEHPLASRLPKASLKPAVVGDSTDFLEFSHAFNGPKSLDDYIYYDRPQLALHIVSFNNATLVSLNWLHTLFDALGRQELITAWTAMLDGRENDIKPFHGFDDDPLADLGTKPKEEYVLADKLLSKWQMAWFVFRQIWETIYYREEETKLVCMPATYLRKLKLLVNQEVKAQNAGSATAFVSEGDVVSAFITRLFIRHLPNTSNQTIVIMNAFGMRSTLADDYLPPDRAYVGNAITAVLAISSAKDILTNPLSYTAWAVRKAIMDQGSREQLEARIAAQKAIGFPLYGDGGMQMITVSNWSKAKFFEADFSAAVIKKGAGSNTRPDRLGKPSFVMGDTISKGLSLRNASNVVGRDADGNVWLGGVLRKGLWANIAEALETDSC